MLKSFFVAMCMSMALSTFAQTAPADVVPRKWEKHRGGRGEGHHGPCLEDIKKLCPQTGAKQDGGSSENFRAKHREVMECMKKNHDSLSPACKSKIEERKEKMKSKIEDCKTDVETLCKDHIRKPEERAGSRGGILKCLWEQKEKLSETCKKHFNRDRPFPGHSKKQSEK